MKRKANPPHKPSRNKAKGRKRPEPEVLPRPEVLPPEGAALRPPANSAASDYVDFEKLDGSDETADTEAAEGPATESSPTELEPDPSDADLASSLPALRSSDTSLVDVESITTSVHDPLRRYLGEIRRYPLLEPEKEFELAMRLKNDGDVTAARTLVSANLRLVVKIAFEYRTFYSNLLDLIQEGNIGLMKAVSKFDPTRGARLGYYASWWIRSYILKYLLDNFRLVKIGTTQAQKKLFYHLMREKERLEAQGLLTGPRLLAEKLHVREKDVVEMEQRLSGRGAEMSLDAPIGNNDGDGRSSSHADQLSDEKESVDDVLAREQLLQILSNRLPEFEKRLNEKERHILKGRLLAEEPLTLQEVADSYGLTRERARQIEVKVIAKLRDFLKEDF